MDKLDGEYRKKNDQWYFDLPAPADKRLSDVSNAPSHQNADQHHAKKQPDGDNINEWLARG